MGSISRSRWLLILSLSLIVCVLAGHFFLGIVPRMHATLARSLRAQGVGVTPDQGRAPSIHEIQAVREFPRALGAAAVRGGFNLRFAAPPSLGRLSTLEAAYGCALVRSNPALGVHTFRRLQGELDVAYLGALRAESDVCLVEPDYLASPAAVIPDDQMFAAGAQDALRAIRCPEAWDVTTGDPSIVVAVLDTGVSIDHPDLKDNCIPGWDFHANDAIAEDFLGHGTAMASIIAARGNDGWGMAGVCWRATILPVKVCDDRGYASFSALAAGIVYAADQGARIINISLGARIGSDVLLQAVRYARDKGSLLVASAGNEASNLEMFPAAYPEVLAVGGASLAGELGFTTNAGVRTRILAPSEDVTVALPPTHGVGSCCGGAGELPGGHAKPDGSTGVFSRITGTSASSAFVSGVAALVLSAHPQLQAPQLRQALVGSARLVRGVDGRLPLGMLDAMAALALATPDLVDLAVGRVELLPATPRAGGEARVRVRIDGKGMAASTGGRVVVTAGDRRAEVELAALAVGEQRWLETSLYFPAAQRYEVTATLQGIAGDADPGNDRAAHAVQALERQAIDLAVTAIDVAEARADITAVELTGAIENRGNADVAGAVVLFTINDQEVDRLALDLRAGQSHAVSGRWSLPARIPPGMLRYRLEVQSDLLDETPANNGADLDLLLSPGADERLAAQYQQGGDIDIIFDAPFRLQPQRPYLPLLVFVPDKGAKSHQATLEFEHFEVSVKDDADPGVLGTSVYIDTVGADPSQAPAGLQVIDEQGWVVQRGAQPDLNLFAAGGGKLDVRGRHNILRLPRAVLGVAAQPAQPERKFILCRGKWVFRRSLLFFNLDRRGDVSKTLAVDFAAADLPALPGENHYLDTHVHTIAEWYFSSSFNLLAPRKAYGGPVQMYRETAYALGLIDHPSQLGDKVITTDHSTFYNRQVPDPDDEDVRPPYGETSPGLNPLGGGAVRDEFLANRKAFGELTAGQEVAFFKKVYGLVPLGAHMLTYRGEHIEGPWHGGSSLSQSVGQGAPVYLQDVLGTLAKRNRVENQNAFTYSAHPFSQQGWDPEHLDLALGVSPQRRNRDFVHAGSDDFVWKGLQLFNGRNVRHLDSKVVDFDHLHPFSQPSFQAGSADWDKDLQKGLVEWHKLLSQTVDWSFDAAPAERFSRKHYIAGGSDAHGDFNYGIGRLATTVPLQSTFSVDDNAFAKVRTYVFAGAKGGATPSERYMQAFADGNSVVTDGPVLRFWMDGEGRFDSDGLVWHDGYGRFENEEGRIGGDGDHFDGGGTVLVERGSLYTLFKYRYHNTADFGGGDLTSIKIYKDEPGLANATRPRGGFQQIVGRGRLRTLGAGADLVQEINPAREGAINAPSAISLGGFTGPDPDTADLGPDDYRCYTNPIWCLPYDAAVQVDRVDVARGEIPAGALHLRLNFDLSTDGGQYGVEVKALDKRGESSAAGQSPLGQLVPAGAWQDARGIARSSIEFVNGQAIPMGAEAYPAAGKRSFVIYLRDPLRDVHGNALHAIAKTFTVDFVASATSAQVAPRSTSGGAAPAAVGSTTSSSGSKAPAGGGGGGGGCSSLVVAGDPLAVWPLLMLLGLLLVGRGRMRFCKGA